jgi:bacillithiol biosynthesis cysteine-adding enzyme BshC
MMESSCRYIEYAQTGMFSKLITDYLSGNQHVNAFVRHLPDAQGVKKAIEDRQKFPTNRKLLQDVFLETYPTPTSAQKKNMALLSGENTFTICTAHQPNIFSGYLYFIYKTAHTIALAQKLKADFPACDFVPVFYIGSEDNDLDELSKFKINGKPYRWETDQTGAVGRMKVDKGVTALLHAVESELAHMPHASDLMAILRKAYAEGNDMAEASFHLLNQLFGEEGLLVLQPDKSDLKQQIKNIMRDDLLSQTAEKVVTVTSHQLDETYKLQVNPRPVNLFYLRDGIRNRIDKRGNQYSVDGTIIRFSEEEILRELDEYPERFSPNVILRGIYQETILPNIIFVGGGSEVAYWMQLKGLFEHYHVPYPVLVLRNSFMIMDAHQEHKMKELGIGDAALFMEETALANQMVQQWSDYDLSLEKEEKESKQLFDALRKRAGEVDKTLVQHVFALETFHMKKLESLEKKMLKAERNKQSVQLQRIWKLKAELFPNNSLQERSENFMPYYSRYGQDFIQTVLKHSLALVQRFGVIVLNS